MLLDGFLVGLQLGSLLTLCVFCVQVLSSCVCFVLLLISLSLFGVYSPHQICEFVLLRRSFELDDTLPPVSASGSLRYVLGSQPLTWM